MPSFTTQVANLYQTGPIVDVGIWISQDAETAIKVAGDHPVHPIDAVALIDTGATGSVLQKGIADRLQLKPVGITYINTPSSSNVRCPEYAIRFLFRNNVVFETTAIEAPLQGQPIQCLIGRDVLAQSVLIYVGYTNTFTLSF